MTMSVFLALQGVRLWIFIFTWSILTSSLLGFEVRLWVNWGIIGIEFEFLLDTDQNDSQDQSIFVHQRSCKQFLRMPPRACTTFICEAV